MGVAYTYVVVYVGNIRILISIPEETLQKLRAFLIWKYQGDWRGFQSREIRLAIEEYIARRVPETTVSEVIKQIEEGISQEEEKPDDEKRGYA